MTPDTGLIHRIVRRLAALPPGRMSHAAACRTWWLAGDRRPGAWTRARLDRHLADCPGCRAALDPAAIQRVVRLASPAAQPVPGLLTARLTAAATERLARAQTERRDLASAQWSRWVAGSVATACAAGLALAVVAPRLGHRPDELARIETRVASLEDELDLARGEAATPALRATLDDSLSGLESGIKCLRTIEDDPVWIHDFPGGDPCVDS